MLRWREVTMEEIDLEEVQQQNSRAINTIRSMVATFRAMETFEDNDGDGQMYNAGAGNSSLTGTPRG
jgi:hypothetical protein